MYASLAGTTHELFRLAPPAGNTVADLLGGAGTPVGGRAQFSCSFAQGEQPQPRTAFAGFTAGAEQTGAGARTDAGFSENPLTDGIFVTPPPDSKGYRLFSSARIQVEHRGTALLSASVAGALLTDAGNECVPGVSVCLQAPPLRVDMAPTFTRIDANRVRVTWGVRGRPPSVTEPAFATIRDRTCVFVWHRVKATIDCSSGVPVVTSPTVEGSRFPSHRLWLDGAMMHDVRQGPLSALWSEEPGDPTRVR